MTSSGPAANTYRVGDFVYFEDPNAPDSPYQIRRIDELNRTQNGVEARVVLYMRRRDVPVSLLKIADQAQRRFDNYYEVDKKKPENFSARGFVVAAEDGVKKEDGDEEGKVEEVETNKEEVKSEETNGEQKDEPKKESASTTEKANTEAEATKTIDWGTGGLPIGADSVSDENRLKLRQREIFLSRQSEILPAHQIRGKCRVTLLGEVENCSPYLETDDLFFYSLVYDPINQTLLADKGAIRVGEKYQAVVDEFGEEGTVKKVEENGDEKMEQSDDEENGALKIDEEEEVKPKTTVTRSPQDEADRDVQVYHPHHNLTERDIDQFLIIARAVGTFARALDSSSTSKIPTLHVAASCASRDVTILHAMSLLHHAEYDVGKAVKFLVPTANKQHYPLETDKATGNQTQTLGGPLLCRDQMEEWSTPEANLFDEALEKCGKDFSDIRADYLPWKSIRDIVEYYYQYKASNRYTERKKMKQAEADTKLKQVYIPSYNKTQPAVIGNYNMTQSMSKSEVTCENCSAEESQNWFSWGGKGTTRLCQACWTKWKRFGGLERKHELELYDKKKAAAAPPATATANIQNGSDKPLNLNALGGGQMRTTAPIANNNQTAKLALGGQAISNEALYNAAKNALKKGQISEVQMKQLSVKLGIPYSAAPKPASKPNIVFYTTICRRVVRRILPKRAFNSKRLARKPFSNIDLEAILKQVAITDRSTLIDTARNLIGPEKAARFNEADFNKGMIHLQHLISAAAAAGKRPAAGNVVGEPAAKLQKALLQQQPSNGGILMLQPTRQMIPNCQNYNPVVANTLVAVNNAIMRGETFVNCPTSSNSHSYVVPISQGANLTPPVVPVHVVASVTVPQPSVNADSVYTELKLHGLRFYAGPQLKSERRRLVSHYKLRKYRRRPLKHSVNLLWLNTQLSKFLSENSKVCLLG